MTPIQPFCIAANKDTVFAVAFAYNSMFPTSTSPTPDYFVLFNGTTPTGLRKDLTWTLITSTPRHDVGIFPDVTYSHACGVSLDGSMFMLHSKSADNNQKFSVRIPIRQNSVIKYVTDTEQTIPDSYTWSNGFTNGPNIVMPTTDFGPPTAPTTAAPRQSLLEVQDWIHLQGARAGNYTDALMFRSVNGTFPEYPQSGMSISGKNNASYIIYDLQERISKIKWWITPPNREKYTYWVSNPVPVLAPISETSALLSDGVNLFWVDKDLTFDFYNIDSVASFVADNPNPDMVTSPLTFSGTITFTIVIGFLILAANLVWLQRRFFKWRADKWVDDADIPGSKVAAEAESSNEDHGRFTGHSSQNHAATSLSDQTLQDRGLSFYVPPSSSTSTSGGEARTTITIGEGRSNNASSSGGRSDELELVTFSSHPRPSVVTTITDGSTDTLSEPH
ncbi:hypothetical protein BGZ83_008971 [Gryganskiella cystojenkinii]|nr:hypothetical protein BGZ83_008971 [Gryganskiella cystojenkinii]